MDAPTVLILNAMQRAQRISLLLAAYGCTSSLKLTLIVYKRDHEKCVTAVAAATAEGACGSGCACAVSVTEPTHMHQNIAQYATGERDLLYTHMDMFVNVSMINFMRRQNATISPAHGLQMGSERVESWCMPRQHLQNCTGAQQPGSPRTCNGRTWWWWSQADVTCRVAARALNLDVCCYGWADFVWLPAHAHRTFRRLATGGSSLEPLATNARLGHRLLRGAARYNRDDFREVMHEVAIPTILHHMQAEPWGRVRWRRLDCEGSCCSSFRPGEFIHRAAQRPLLCAHKIYLPSLYSPPGQRRRWERAPYRGFFDKQHACRLAVDSGWYVPPGQRQRAPMAVPVISARPHEV